MSKRRQERMAVEFKRSLSQILQEDIKDPRIDFSTVSITRVDVSNDLGHARVNISILGDAARQEEVMAVLQKAKGHIRSQMAREFEVRHFPELEFRLDKSIEHGIHISNLLQELGVQQEEKDDHE
ncbi:MAG TPA: 30S ribosome-binding factor RbfA [Syntrophomonadaceae bacterium]|nr:30S ribosome-binding factor RbfA [Syntrophomonadaceae bacterium]